MDSKNKYKMTTKSGLDFYVVASAFQKAVRRCDVQQAMYWGTELYISGYDEYAWSRIIIMVSEDIGIAEPNMPAQIYSLYEFYSMLKKKKNKHTPERLQFIHAINLIARSRKSRLVDNYLGMYFDKRNVHGQPEIPDYVYDMHTMKGKILKRGNDHFFEHSALINNCPESLQEEEYALRDHMQKVWSKDDYRPSENDDAQTQLPI
jgi:replication-associated recombination protein RarA